MTTYRSCFLFGFLIGGVIYRFWSSVKETVLRRNSQEIYQNVWKWAFNHKLMQGTIWSNHTASCRFAVPLSPTVPIRKYFFKEVMVAIETERSGLFRGTKTLLLKCIDLYVFLFKQQETFICFRWGSPVEISCNKLVVEEVFRSVAQVKVIILHCKTTLLQVKDLY